MQSKKLKTLMTVSKVFSILAKIGYICCIVGAICCAIGAIFCVIAPRFTGSFTFDEPTLEKIKLGTAQCVCSAVGCLFGIFLYLRSHAFYKQVLAVGTPFSADVARAMRRLGVLHIVLPLVCAIVVAIIASLMHSTVEFSSSEEFALGFAYIFCSLLLDYGAEIESAHKQSQPYQPQQQGNRSAYPFSNDGASQPDRSSYPFSTDDTTSYPFADSAQNGTPDNP